MRDKAVNPKLNNFGNRLIIKRNGRPFDVNIMEILLDEHGEELRTLPNDSSGARFLLLTPVEHEAVVHLAFFVQCALLHLHFADALLLDLEGLKEQI